MPLRKHTSKNKLLTKEEIQAMGLHYSKVANNANSESFQKLCKHHGKGHKQDQCPAKDKTCSKCNKMSHFAHKFRSSNRLQSHGQ